MPVVKCNNCKEVLNELSSLPEEDRPRCPSCGSTARLYEVFVQDHIEAHDNIRLKAKHGNVGKPYREVFSGDDLWQRTGRWMHREMIIDRDNDLYKKIIKDPVTSEIIYICEEPLSQHRGHGSAKIKDLKGRNDNNSLS